MIKREISADDDSDLVIIKNGSQTARPPRVSEFWKVHFCIKPSCFISYRYFFTDNSNEFLWLDYAFHASM